MSLETLLEAAKIIESRSKGKHVVFCNAHVGACLLFNLLYRLKYCCNSYYFAFSITENNTELQSVEFLRHVIIIYGK